jgi:hypothetical protein
MFVCCECCVLSGRGLCDVLITRPKESYQLWCVVVCDLETSWMRRPWPTLGRSATERKWYMIYLLAAIGLTAGGSSTVHIYTQTIHRTTQSTHTIHGTTQFTN